VGCVTIGLHETARPTPPGKAEFGASVTPLVYYALAETVLGTSSGFLLVPLPELALRFGVVRDFDLGVRWAFGPGAALTAKYRVAKEPVDIAVAMCASGYGLSAAGLSFFSYGVTPRFILSNEKPNTFPFAVNAGLSVSGSSTAGVGAAAAGTDLGLVAGFGLPFTFGSARNLMLMPELAINLPLLSSAQSGGQSSLDASLRGLALSLGVNFSTVAPE
jgi:hypothetical protein